MSASSQQITLDEVLAYRHPGVLSRYCKDNSASISEAEEVFREMLKWLYVGYRSGVEGREGLVVTPEIAQIDEMWHTFLLFTWDYADFCERHFGVFIHHTPGDGDDAVPRPAEEVRTLLEQQYGFIYDELGVETLQAWYNECRYGE